LKGSVGGILKEWIVFGEEDGSVGRRCQKSREEERSGKIEEAG
jgi:hypothetical protein